MILVTKTFDQTHVCICMVDHTLLLLLLLIHTFGVKKLRRHNKSATDHQMPIPLAVTKRLRRSTGHIMVIVRYSDQQGSIP